MQRTAHKGYLGPLLQVAVAIRVLSDMTICYMAQYMIVSGQGCSAKEAGQFGVVVNAFKVAPKL